MEVLIVKERPLNDIKGKEEIIGVAKNYTQAVDIIKDELRMQSGAYKRFHYSIQTWTVGKRYASETIKEFTAEENVALAKSLGVYRY